MAKTKSKVQNRRRTQKQKPSRRASAGSGGGGGGGGALSGMRGGFKGVVGTGKGKDKEKGSQFWNILTWVLLAAAVVLFIVRFGGGC